MDLNNNGISDWKEIGEWFEQLFIKIVDSDGDGKVEIEEIIESLAKAGYTIVKLSNK